MAVLCGLPFSTCLEDAPALEHSEGILEGVLAIRIEMLQQTVLK